MAESTYSRFLEEKQLQRICSDIFSSTQLGDFSEVAQLFPEKGASDFQRTYRYFRNAELADLEAFTLIGSFIHFKKIEKSLSYKEPFYLVFGGKIRSIIESQERIQHKLLKIVAEKLTVTSSTWDSNISELCNLLKEFKKQLLDLMDCKKLAIHFPAFETSLTARCEKELKLLDKDLRRFEQLLQRRHNYPIEDFFLYLPDLLDNKFSEYKVTSKERSEGNSIDLVHIPGRELNMFIELYLKLQVELINARKIRPSSKAANTFHRKTLADYFEEKIAFAKTETIYLEEDRALRLKYLKAARQEVMEKI